MYEAGQSGIDAAPFLIHTPSRPANPTLRDTEQGF